MHDVEPSPVDEEEEEMKLPLHQDDLRTASTTNVLGLTPARTIHILASIQKWSVAPLGVYLTMHYTNTALIPLITQSVPEAEKQLLLTRPYYQSFPLEPIMIFAPVVTHVLSGIALRLYRRRQNAKRHGAYNHKDRQQIPWPKLSLNSALGYALYPMFAAHVIVNRITPLKVEGGSSGVGFRYFAHGMAKHPLFANAGYAAMLCVASMHFVQGAAIYLKKAPEYITDGGDFGRTKKKRRRWLINGIAATVAAAWIAGGLGVIGRGGAGTGWEAKNWDKIYQAVPIVGKWM